MRWLDLFCGEGCVADGLIAAGDKPIGYDINERAQHYYPGAFMRCDITNLFKWSAAEVREFVKAAGIDAIWASPPCLRWTEMADAPNAKGTAHPDLLTPTRAFLVASGLPYVIENVPRAPLRDPIQLCGTNFGLGLEYRGRRFDLQRHRKFETNWPLRPPVDVPGYFGVCAHEHPAVTAIGAHARIRSKAAGGRGTKDFDDYPGGHRAALGAAFGIPPERVITCKGITDGIPPAYSKYIAERLHEHLSAR